MNNAKAKIRDMIGDAIDIKKDVAVAFSCVTAYAEDTNDTSLVQPARELVQAVSDYLRILRQKEKAHKIRPETQAEVAAIVMAHAAPVARACDEPMDVVDEQARFVIRRHALDIAAWASDNEKKEAREALRKWQEGNYGRLQDYMFRIGYYAEVPRDLGSFVRWAFVKAAKRAIDNGSCWQQVVAAAVMVDELLNR